MNEQEQIELLKEVARVAPKGMKAYPLNPANMLYPLIEFGGVPSGFSDRDGDDRVVELDMKEDDVYNAAAIIAMLDVMENAGVRPSLCRLDGPTYRVILFDAGPAGKQAFPCVDCATRTEAVTRAFVTVFRDQDK